MAVPFPRAWIQSWFHRALRELVLQMSMGLLTNIIFAVSALGGTVLLAVLALPSQYTQIGWGVFISLIFLLIVRGLVMKHESSGREALRRKCIGAGLMLLHEEVFQNSEDFRLTFFILDPVAKVRVRNLRDSSARPEWREIIVPFIRRESGQSEVSPVRSNAYFPIGSKTAAGRAWDTSTTAEDRRRKREFEAYITPLRRFRNRAEMEEYYQNKLHVEPHITQRMSNYMVDVVQIWTFPLVDDDGNPMGLLSIDSKEFFDTASNTKNQSGKKVIIDQDKFADYLNSMRATIMKIGFSSS